jgi:diaminohydroxyphosphoribosylaminopyrimidine deaminase/5-amino-6-(5-phosphoribosylamino)uracil reductase
VAEGWHTACGKPHAERECLADARARGIDPRGATLYVTLEPCRHHGRTPPCTDAVLEAGIARVVIGTPDPTPDAGGGAELLRSRGVEVITGVLEPECRELIAEFLHWRDTDRAWCILKMAATLDGRIASRSGRAEAVSSPESFRDVHRYRAFVGAVMVGGATFIGDDPSLTCRLDDGPNDPDGARTPEAQPYAVVVTSRLPEAGCDLQLIRKRPGRTVFLTTGEAADSIAAHSLREIDVRVWGLPPAPGGLDLKAGLARLRGELGCHHVLCEGGGRLATSLVAQGAADEFVLYLAPKILGDDEARPLFTGRTAPSMAHALGMRVVGSGPCGPDVKIVLRPGGPAGGRDDAIPPQAQPPTNGTSP